MFHHLKALLVLSMLSMAFGNVIDFSKAFMEPRNFTNVESTCRTIQKYEIAFSNSCNLQLSNIQNSIKRMKNYVMKQTPTLSIADLLSQGFDGSTQYFQDTYPEFNTEYKDFEDKIIAIMNKLKPSSTGAKMIEFKNAILDTKMDVIFNNITGRIGTKTCGQDNGVCPRADSMFNINLDTLPLQTVHEFLTVSAKNMIKQLELEGLRPLEIEDANTAVEDLLESLRLFGTAKTNTEIFQNLLQTKLYDKFEYYYSDSYSAPTSRKIRTTTFKATKTTGTKAEKVTPQQYVTIEVYLSVPLVILLLGVIFTVVIIFAYYRCTPHVGGTAKMAPTTAASAQVQYKSSKI